MIRKCALFAFGLIALHVGALAQQVPQVQNAICVLKTTNFAAPLNLNVTGSVEFTTLLNNGVPQIQISANFAGLNAGDTYSFHVHTFGTWSGDGTATGGHLGLCDTTQPPCRPSAPASDQYSVGWMPGAVNLPAQGDGTIQTTFTDDLLSLNGPNSIIGRGLILHNAQNTRIGFCVIGRNDTADQEKAAPLVDDIPNPPSRLSCRFRGTTVGGADVIRGWLTAQQIKGGVMVRWAITGLQATSPVTGLKMHNFHVHQAGNIIDGKAATATLGHFVGTCNSCRQYPAPLQEVGQLGNGYPLYIPFDGALSSGSFNDSVIQMSGVNSIVGRSVVVHGLGTDGTVRVAQCVLGIDNVTVSPPAPVTSATCLVDRNQAKVSGFVTFSQSDVAPGVQVNYLFGGLPQSSSVSWRIDQAGDMNVAYAQVFQGQACQQNPNCRPKAPANAQSLGWLGNGQPLMTSSYGVAQDVLVDSLLSLNGVDSIVGRALTILDGNGNETAKCVIGRAVQDVTVPDADFERSASAACVFQPTVTGLNTLPLSDWNALQGVVRFTQKTASDPLSVVYTVSGLPANTVHSVHVHVGGDIIDTDNATTVLAHFVGMASNPDGTPLRPDCPKDYLNEVGSLDDCRTWNATDQGYAYGSFMDQYAQLSGVNNIIGRSLIIHLGYADPAVNTGAARRVATCVIGRGSEPPTPVLPTQSPAAANASLPLAVTLILVGLAVGLVAANAAYFYSHSKRRVESTESRPLIDA